MPQKRTLNLSDIIRDPDSVIEDLHGITEDDDIEYVKEYGIGIDCHSRFIEVCIRYRNGQHIQKAQGHFTTDWDGLTAGRDWCIDILKTKTDPMPDLTGPLHYLVESTASYHMPVCMAWGGDPKYPNV